MIDYQQQKGFLSDKYGFEEILIGIKQITIYPKHKPLTINNKKVAYRINPFYETKKPIHSSRTNRL